MGCRVLVVGRCFGAICAPYRDNSRSHCVSWSLKLMQVGTTILTLLSSLPLLHIFTMDCVDGGPLLGSPPSTLQIAFEQIHQSPLPTTTPRRPPYNYTATAFQERPG